ncbi:hypothetical protein ACFL13_00160 [Patescibacteria group bacterium]
MEANTGFVWAYYIRYKGDCLGVTVLRKDVENLFVPEDWRVSSWKEHIEKKLRIVYSDEPEFEELGFKIIKG